SRRLCFLCERYREGNTGERAFQDYRSLLYGRQIESQAAGRRRPGAFYLRRDCKAARGEAELSKHGREGNLCAGLASGRTGGIADEKKECQSLCSGGDSPLFCGGSQLWASRVSVSMAG